MIFQRCFQKPHLSPCVHGNTQYYHEKMISALQDLRTEESYPVNSLCQQPAITLEYKTQFQILATGHMNLSHFISHK